VVTGGEVGTEVPALEVVSVHKLGIARYAVVHTTRDVTAGDIGIVSRMSGVGGVSGVGGGFHMLSPFVRVRKVHVAWRAGEKVSIGGVGG
jgi:hypothetical protein